MKVNYMLNSLENGRLPLTSKRVDYHRLFRVFPPMLNWGLWPMLAFSDLRTSFMLTPIATVYIS